MSALYPFETHCHTQESSACASVPAAQLVDLYRAAGYAGIVVTDHCYDGGEDTVHMDRARLEGKAHACLAGYRLARKAAGQSMAVLPAMELRFLESENDYLVYGADATLIVEHPDLFTWGIRRFMPFARERGYFVVQAHPFRDRMEVLPPSLVGAIEVYNGHRMHDSRNDIAAQWAEKYSLVALSGSDTHETPGAVRGGVLLPSVPMSSVTLIAMLRAKPALIQTP